MPNMLAKKIKSSKTTIRKPSKSIWDGPCDNGPKGGITQSMLSLFLVCRERFRIKCVKGITPVDTFNHRIEYGQMWHVCEEAFANDDQSWLKPLKQYSKRLCELYPTQQEQIVHWMNVCKIQFPVYVAYWEMHPDVKQRSPLLQECAFHAPYSLPSGRTVHLRGKWDSVDLIGKGKTAGIYLQENKTKGEIKEEQMKQQLGFDLQTMFYLVALNDSITSKRSYLFDGKKLVQDRVSGVRYNVVRRPLSGGKGSITRWKPSKANPLGETEEHFYGRLREVIQEDPANFFMRWRVEITPGDVERFKHDFLTPCLEQLCDWYDWITSPQGREDPFSDHLHCRTPYGIYNPLAEGRSTDLDEYLASGDTLGLQQGKPLFTELE